MKTEFASKAIIIKNEKILLLRKSKDDPVSGNRWEFPGGRIELGESPEECLLRDVKEETGLEIEIVKPLKAWSFFPFTNNETQLVGVTFLCCHISGEAELTEEHTEFKWLAPEEIARGDFADWLKEEVKMALSEMNF